MCIIIINNILFIAYSLSNICVFCASTTRRRMEMNKKKDDEVIYYLSPIIIIGRKCTNSNNNKWLPKKPLLFYIIVRLFPSKRVRWKGCKFTRCYSNIKSKRYFRNNPYWNPIVTFKTPQNAELSNIIVTSFTHNNTC